jgi:hypothetical protein
VILDQKDYLGFLLKFSKISGKNVDPVYVFIDEFFHRNIQIKNEQLSSQHAFKTTMNPFKSSRH